MIHHAAIRRGAAMLLVAGLPLAAPALSPEETVAAAERAEKGGALVQAAGLYEQFLKANPEHIQRSTVQYRLAMVLENMGRTEPAMDAFKQVIASPADRSMAKHRPDAFMHLAKMQADVGKHGEAAATLEQLFKEGAGLYEDEAQNLRAGYLTILGKHDEAAVLFNVLRNKPSSPFAKEAAYKLALVWMKANNDELAKSSIEEFAQRYPQHPRVVELFIRLARVYYDKKNFKSAADLCHQVMTGYKDSPEAIEAAFIVALSYRDAGKLEEAVNRLEAVAKMPQATHNTLLASESLFEAGQICRKSLKNAERALDLYSLAANKARDRITERQTEILEKSLFYAAEELFRQEKWSAALDLYAELRKAGSKLNLLSRVLHCQSKMSADGGASMGAETEEELGFIRQRIADNPGTLVALQSEIFLIDRKLARLRPERVGEREVVSWSFVQPILDEYATLLTKYPDSVLKQQDLRSYLRMRMGGVYAYVDDEDPQRLTRLRAGILLLEQALAEAPEALFRVEALESLAFLSARAFQNEKALATYKKLYALTGQDPQARTRRAPSEYLQGMVATANTTDLADEAMNAMRQVIDKSPPTSEEAREARFYLAELLYMKQRFSEAAKAYKEFVKTYGPPQGADGKVAADWKKPGEVDPALDRVYEAGLRVAHCWRSQGHTTNMVAAYRWVVENQNHLNSRVAEAAYMALVSPVNIPKLPAPKKEVLGRDLWTQVVNPSLDFESKAFKEGFFPWVRESRAVPFVRVALLKAAQLSADAGNHRRAAQMYQQYLELYNPDNQGLRDSSGRSRFARDEFFFMASYAVGREYVLANDAEAMVKAFQGYVDGMRDSKFRPAALQLMGHYGTQAELFADAAEAYAALLDEYELPSSTNALGLSATGTAEPRLRKQSSWNGIRMPLPEKWDPGQIRFGLGYLYWKKEQWEPCQNALRPFLTDPSLRKSASRAEALFMYGRSSMKTGLITAGQKAMDRLIAEHPDFKGIEDVYMDVARSHVGFANWPAVEQCHAAYVAKHPAGMRRSFMDMCAALAQIGKGQVAAGEKTLTDLAKSDTFEDVKAEAYFRLGQGKQKATPPDLAGALSLMRKSLDTYPQAPALLEAGRCAVELKNWAAAREYLDRLVREFPKADREQIEQAQQLRRKVMESEAGTRR